MKYVAIALLTISLNGFLSSIHRNVYFDAYQTCVGKFQDQEEVDLDQVEKCASDNIVVTILGTILFTDGSVFGYYYYGLGNG